jgi:hypothetical protein
MFEEGGFEMARRFRRRVTKSLEQELRLYRPQPADDFFHQVTTEILADAPQRPARRLSLAFAGALASLLVAALAAFGGIGYAASAAEGVAQTAQKVVAPKAKTRSVQSAAADQYVGKETICHHTGSQSHPFVTITISKNAEKAHLAHGDTLGPCPPGGVLGSQASRRGAVLGATATNSSLPFTGLGLLGVVLLAAIALGTGVALRRSSRA